ncbi:MAG: hypothetical protein KGV44_10285 [Flavobacteriaceae bacterium]|nr:hypothetical protein [Flavobacteriaceae bacterium]
MKKVVFLFIICLSQLVFAQKRRIKIVNSDDVITDAKYPNVKIALGNVFISYEGGTLRCKKAYLYEDKNEIMASEEVVMNQGDTIFQYSDYALYNSDTKLAKSWGKVILKDPTMTLEAKDTLYFDRVKQEAYYNNGATIKDSTSVLVSKKGRFYTKTQKFSAKNNVQVTNKDSKLVSENLDYFTNTGEAHIFGASTIYGKKDSIYTEKGYYNSKTGIAHLLKNSKIYYKNRIIEGDSIYNDSHQNFTSATNNIKVTDTINKSTVTGNYVEVYRLKDSLIMTKKPMIAVKLEKDSMYVHGKHIVLTGKEGSRLSRIYPKVKMFKKDMQGKCDSLVMTEHTGLTELLKKPILWLQGNQMTGDTIHLLSNTKTEKMDSLKVLNNGFMIQKDSVGYSQLKGKNMYGKFKDNEMETLDIVGNSEVVFYLRNEKKELVGITKMESSKDIFITFLKRKIKMVDFNKKPNGKTYPPSKFPEKEKLLKGFAWREEEKPLTKDDIFKVEEPKKIENVEEKKQGGMLKLTDETVVPPTPKKLNPKEKDTPKSEK